MLIKCVTVCHVVFSASKLMDFYRWAENGAARLLRSNRRQRQRRWRHDFLLLTQRWRHQKLLVHIHRHRSRLVSSATFLSQRRTASPALQSGRLATQKQRNGCRDNCSHAPCHYDVTSSSGSQQPRRRAAGRGEGGDGIPRGDVCRSKSSKNHRCVYQAFRSVPPVHRRPASERNYKSVNKYRLSERVFLNGSTCAPKGRTFSCNDCITDTIVTSQRACYSSSIIIIGLQWL